MSTSICMISLRKPFGWSFHVGGNKETRLNQTMPGFCTVKTRRALAVGAMPWLVLSVNSVTSSRSLVQAPAPGHIPSAIIAHDADGDRAGKTYGVCIKGGVITRGRKYAGNAPVTVVGHAGRMIPEAELMSSRRLVESLSLNGWFVSSEIVAEESAS